MAALPSSDAGTATPAAGPLLDALDSWTDASKHVLNSYLEANRAVMAGLGLRSATGERVGAPIAELSYVTPGWSFERSVDTRAELGVGDFVRFSKPVLDDDVHAFAQASGDTNRLHLDDGFAAETRFGGPIAHGTLVSGLISAALARLPGLTVYLSQDVEYRGPVEIGDVVTAECEIVEDLGDEQYRLTTRVHTDEGETVIDGEAVVLIDEPPDG
ncbi:acyl dehydratase [Halobacteriales archaeon QS_4_69_34]|nr:MAG: acyl dehydratase [Halobacteriales archaeon QS_4_69_34]